MLAMKLLIAGLATGLLAAAAPAWADRGENDGWRRNASVQQVRHGDHRWDERGWSAHRHYDRHHRRHWERRYERHDRHYYPRQRQYYYRDYTYGYSEPPSVWFSWSLRD
jgi:hypothetical protein